MATQIHIGQRVRINEKYGALKLAKNSENQVGVEFTVTGVAYGSSPVGHESSQIIKGDPNGHGVWGDFLDVVPSKAHTTTRVMARLNWEGIEKIVDITSGSSAIGLTVKPNPSKYGDTTGSTSLTLEQAEEIAHDLLARVAEIRAAQ